MIKRHTNLRIILLYVFNLLTSVGHLICRWTYHILCDAWTMLPRPTVTFPAADHCRCPLTGTHFPSCAEGRRLSWPVWLVTYSDQRRYYEAKPPANHISGISTKTLVVQVDELFSCACVSWQQILYCRQLSTYIFVMLIRLDSFWVKFESQGNIGQSSRSLEENNCSATAEMADRGGKTDLNWKP